MAEITNIKENESVIDGQFSDAGLLQKRLKKYANRKVKIIVLGE